MGAAKSILHMPARLKSTNRLGRHTSDFQIPLARDRFAQIGLALRQFAHRRSAGVVAWSTSNLQAYSESTSSSSCCLGPERRRGNFKRAGMFGGGSAARRWSCSARGLDRAAHMPAGLNLLRRGAGGGCGTHRPCVVCFFFAVRDERREKKEERRDNVLGGM